VGASGRQLPDSTRNINFSVRARGRAEKAGKKPDLKIAWRQDKPEEEE